MWTREASWMAVSVVLSSALIVGCNAAEAPGVEDVDTAPAEVASAPAAVEEPAMPGHHRRPVSGG